MSFLNLGSLVDPYIVPILEEFFEGNVKNFLTVSCNGLTFEATNLYMKASAPMEQLGCLMNVKYGFIKSICIKVSLTLRVEVKINGVYVLLTPDLEDLEDLEHPEHSKHKKSITSAAQVSKDIEETRFVFEEIKKYFDEVAEHPQLGMEFDVQGSGYDFVWSLMKRFFSHVKGRISNVHIRFEWNHKNHPFVVGTSIKDMVVNKHKGSRYFKKTMEDWDEWQEIDFFDDSKDSKDSESSPSTSDTLDASDAFDASHEANEVMTSDAKDANGAGEGMESTETDESDSGSDWEVVATWNELNEEKENCVDGMNKKVKGEKEKYKDNERIHVASKIVELDSVSLYLNLKKKENENKEVVHFWSEQNWSNEKLLEKFEQIPKQNEINDINQYVMEPTSLDFVWKISTRVRKKCDSVSKYWCYWNWFLA